MIGIDILHTIDHNENVFERRKEQIISALFYTINIASPKLKNR